MAIDRVREYFQKQGIEGRIRIYPTSAATVELAAQAAGCTPGRIAKTLSFHVDGRVVLVVLAGDTRIDNAKFKAVFGVKPKMLKAEEAEPLIGHAVGGVCPFAVNEGVAVYLDEALTRFETVFPACGSSDSVIELGIQELVALSKATGWVDISKMHA